jgi:hypothetical protein
MPPPKKKGEALPPLDEVLESLASRRIALDKLDTDISALIQRVEAGLMQHFSVRVATALEDGSDGSGFVSYLAFGKLDGRWQLMIESGFVDDGGSLKTTSLLSCPRETRLKAFTEGYIERLIRDAVVNLDRQIESRTQALQSGALLAQMIDGAPF